MKKGKPCLCGTPLSFLFDVARKSAAVLGPKALADFLILPPSSLVVLAHGAESGKRMQQGERQALHSSNCECPFRARFEAMSTRLTDKVFFFLTCLKVPLAARLVLSVGHSKGFSSHTVIKHLSIFNLTTENGNLPFV